MLPFEWHTGENGGWIRVGEDKTDDVKQTFSLCSACKTCPL